MNKIRTARAEDLPAIEAIVHEAYAPYIERIGQKPAPMSDDYVALIHDGAVLVLIDHVDVAGLIVLKDKVDHILIYNVAVAPRYQGKGLGKMLLAYAESHARARNIQQLRLFTNEKMLENIAIYEKLGWHEYNRSAQDGFHRVFMQKTLNSSCS